MKHWPYALLMLLLTAAPARAQNAFRPEEFGGWSLLPSFQVLGVYEDNLLVTAGPTTKGAFGRITPSLETRYKGPLGFFNLGYSFDSERHKRELKVLDDVLARQVGAMSFEARPTERSFIAGRMRYMATHRPEEVLDETGLVASERRTTSFVASLSTERNTSESSRASLGYTITVDDFGQATEVRPGAGSILHVATAGLRFQRTERLSIGAEYNGRLLTGEERTIKLITTGTFWSHSAGVRWTQSLTPHLTVSAFAGPRLAQTVPTTITPAVEIPISWERAPEVRASLTYRNVDDLLAVNYGRSQELGFGASGFIDTEAFELRAARVIAHRLQIGGRPGFYRNALAGQHARSYRLEGTAHYAISRWLSLDGVFGYRYQDRALALSDLQIASVGKSRTRTRAAIGVTIQRPISMK